MGWPRGWPYTDDQVNRLFRTFAADVVFEVLGNCILEEFEDYLRAQDAAAIRQFRSEGSRHWTGSPTIYFPPTRLRHYFAVYDFDEVQRRRSELSAADRHALDFPVHGIPGAAWGPNRLHTLRGFLHRRAHGAPDLSCNAQTCGPPGSNLSRFRSMQHLGERFVSGAEDRIQQMGFVIAGAIVATPLVMQSARAAAAAQPEVPQVQGGAMVPGRVQARTAPGIGPFRELGPVTGQTLEGLGPDGAGHMPPPPVPPAGGHAPSLPPPRTGQTAQGLGPRRFARTEPGIGGPVPRPAPRSLPAAVEEAAAARPLGWRLAPGNWTEGLSEEVSARLWRNQAALPDYQWRGFSSGDYQAYVREWQAYGGTGAPPRYGFVVRMPSGEPVRFVGFQAEPGWTAPAPAPRAPAPRPAMGVPEGGSVAPLSEQERATLYCEERTANNFLPTPSGRELYRAEWRAYGGTGEPPPHGFIVRNADGTIHRVVGFGAVPERAMQPRGFRRWRQ